MPYSPSTYSGDPNESMLDEMRFKLQDVGEGGLWLLTDVEYQYLLDKWLPRFDSPIGVASVAADTIAARFAGAVSITADGVSVNVGDLSGRYRELAAQLRTEYSSSQLGEANIDSILADFQPDPSIAPLDFGRGMHDNPEAGRQAYGSYAYGANGSEWPFW